ncbi:MAG: primase C-terminal domain-containing protein [Bacillota bacterium]|nr:primase C-terminal domain-containing protein [Bacillota bacterium]
MINPVAAHRIVVSAMEALRFLLHGSLTEAPKCRGEQGVINSNDLAWVFVAGKEFQPVAVRTYATLEKKLPGVIYFTPNTFFHRRRKDKASLRWLNCFFVDIDDPELCLLDALERIRCAGLPEPSILNRTPGGWHLYWKIERVRATAKALKLYEALQRKIVAAIGADPMAASAEHFMRIPFSIQYFTSKAYQIQDLVDWADVNCPEWRTEKCPGAVVASEKIVEHLAIQKLLGGVEEGRRGSTAFTLALAMRCAGYTQEQALDELTRWNFLNQPPLSYSQVKSAVKSAFSGRYRGPSARMISELSGVEFHHRVRRSGGSENGGCGGRKRGTTKEAREKFLLWLKAQGRGKKTVVTDMSQKEIAQLLGVAPRTLSLAIGELKAAGVLMVKLKNFGRGKHQTTYILNLPENGEKDGGEQHNRNRVVDISLYRLYREQRRERRTRGPRGP